MEKDLETKVKRTLINVMDILEDAAYSSIRAIGEPKIIISTEQDAKSLGYEKLIPRIEQLAPKGATAYLTGNPTYIGSESFVPIQYYIFVKR